MQALLLLSKQRTLIETWRPILATHYKLTLSSEVFARDFSQYPVVIVDSQFIDNQAFSMATFKQFASKFLIIGEQWSDAQQVSALAAGAAGYCEVKITASILLKAVDRVLNNDIWIQRRLIHKVIGALVTNSPMAQPAPKPSLHNEPTLACLSKREKDVAHLICQGISNKAIASALFISERTVKAHLTSIFSKLQVTNRLHLGLLLKATEE